MFLIAVYQNKGFESPFLIAQCADGHNPRSKGGKAAGAHIPNGPVPVYVHAQIKYHFIRHVIRARQLLSWLRELITFTVFISCKQTSISAS